MGLFHTDLEDQIEHIAKSLKKESSRLKQEFHDKQKEYQENQDNLAYQDESETEQLDMPEEWHWLDYNAQDTIHSIESKDLEIFKKLAQLHKEGKDISSLTLRIVQLCNELRQHLEELKKSKGQTDSKSISDEEKKVKDKLKMIDELIEEIYKIYQQEFEMLERESKKLLFNNAVIQHYKKLIISLLNSKPPWESIEKLILEAITSRKTYKEFEQNITELISKGGKYEKQYKEYKQKLNDLETEIKQTTEMYTENDGPWFHVGIAPTLKGKKFYKGFSFKIYHTIDISDEENIWRVLDNLPILLKWLKKYARNMIHKLK